MSAEHPSFFEDIPEVNIYDASLAAPDHREATRAGAFDADFSFEDPSHAAREAMDKVAQCLKEVDWPEEEIEPFAAAVGEAVRSATERDDPTVHMRIEVRMDEVVVRIDDPEAGAMAFNEAEDPEGPERVMIPRSEAARTMFAGCDEVAVYPDSGEIHLIKRRGGAAASLGADAFQG